ncbi:polymorphic toxin type 50 domain-containing protein [Lactovum odontotermitis]
MDLEDTGKQLIKQYPKNVARGKQNKHVLDSNSYKLGSSYLSKGLDVQQLVNKYSGTGQIAVAIDGKTGHVNIVTETITTDEVIGYALTHSEKYLTHSFKGTSKNCFL